MEKKKMEKNVFLFYFSLPVIIELNSEGAMVAALDACDTAENTHDTRLTIRSITLR